MGLLESIKPRFWDHYDVSSTRHREVYNFRRIWQLTVLITAGVAIIPLVIMVVFDHQVTRTAYEREIFLRTSRLISHLWPTVTFFLSERKSALEFIVHDRTVEQLTDKEQLGAILEGLKTAFGGFTDLGVIESTGYQRTYAGSFELEGKDYHNEAWFKEVLDQGVFISEVFLGYRHIPHIVIAIKHDIPSGSFYVLRATLDMEQFNSLLSQIELTGLGDVFIINHLGTIQTPSRHHGKVFEKMTLPLPVYSDRPQVVEVLDLTGDPVLMGSAFIEQTPFVLLLINEKKHLMQPWYETRSFVYVFLGMSITIILLVILSVTTFLVSTIFAEEQKKVAMLHHIEYSNKLVSLGRLAAGVAHEINNPLAIINEKAGLINDLFVFTEKYAHDEKLLKCIESILASVERCSKITRRLLGFARHLDVSLQAIDFSELSHEVLDFLGKEASYRSIDIVIDVPPEIPRIVSDRGKLQQIFLNIVNNAFSAMSDGGRFKISVKQKSETSLDIVFSDTGYGISEADLPKIFEPFFSTKTRKGGTGLGLSITYGLIKELGGTIEVESTVGVGTTFTVTLPITLEKKEKESEGITHASPAG